MHYCRLKVVPLENSIDEPSSESVARSLRPTLTWSPSTDHWFSIVWMNFWGPSRQIPVRNPLLHG